MIKKGVVQNKGAENKLFNNTIDTFIIHVSDGSPKSGGNRAIFGISLRSNIFCF